jgi:hypothetical protein
VKDYLSSAATSPNSGIRPLMLDVADASLVGS